MKIKLSFLKILSLIFVYHIAAGEKDLSIERGTVAPNSDYHITILSTKSNPITIYGISSDSLSFELKSTIAGLFLDVKKNIDDIFTNALSIVQRSGIRSLMLVGINKLFKNLHCAWFGDVCAFLENSGSFSRIGNCLYADNKISFFSTSLSENNHLLVMASPAFIKELSDKQALDITEDYSDNLYRLAEKLQNTTGKVGTVTVLKFAWQEKAAIPISPTKPQPTAAQPTTTQPAATQSITNADTFLMAVASAVVFVALIGGVIFEFFSSKKEVKEATEEQQKKETAEKIEEKKNLSTYMRIKQWWSSLSNAKKYLYGGGFAVASSAAIYTLYKKYNP